MSSARSSTPEVAARISGERRRRAPRPAPLRVGQPARVADQQRHHARARVARQRRAKREPAEQAQHLVGVDGRRVQRPAQDQRHRAQAEHRPVGGRLERDVGVAEQRQLPSRMITVSPSRETSALIDHDQQRERHREQRGAAHLAPDAGAPRRRAGSPPPPRRARAGSRRSSAARPSARQYAHPAAARAACSGLARRR